MGGVGRRRWEELGAGIGGRVGRLRSWEKELGGGVGRMKVERRNWEEELGGGIGRRNWEVEGRRGKRKGNSGKPKVLSNVRGRQYYHMHEQKPNNEKR